MSTSRFQKLKEECCNANRELRTLGLVDLTFGNVSVADRQAGVFAIKPSGVDYEVLEPQHIVVVEIESGATVEGALRYSSDTPTHRRLLMAFAEAGAVVHTHSRDAVAWAQAGRGIPCFGTTHADHFYGEVPVTRPMTPAEIGGQYEWETGNVIVERFEAAQIDPAQVPAVLVHGHGPFVWGPSAAKAVEYAFALEIVAEMAIATLRLNPAAQPISKALLDKHFLRKHGATAYYGQPGAGV
ncbi:L-ribulose-5-phosphate 4-epimerase [Verrucomicrobia bacterium LW23]|nr:L-ribulose-5-phosphate 4-epimerase [Verrucomicrobia bacterium LW23]